jgi:cytochrome c oxidase cbb3-type subunit 3
MHMRRLSLFAVVTALSLAAASAPARPVRRHAPQPAPPAQQAPQPAAPVAPSPEAEKPQPPPTSGPAAQGAPVPPYASPRQILEAPVSTLLPGNTGPSPTIKNPVGGNPEAIQRGMSYFNTFNCSGCHAPNAGGGMGPSLSNKFFVYGGEPQNIYLSIYQGRPNGMPAWGAMLPENIIWDLVAYIHSISREPSSTWGQTFSHEAFNIEQVPAEFADTAAPWKETQRFSFGQKPSEKR